MWRPHAVLAPTGGEQSFCVHCRRSSRAPMALERRPCEPAARLPLRAGLLLQSGRYAGALPKTPQWVGAWLAQHGVPVLLVRRAAVSS